MRLAAAETRRSLLKKRPQAALTMIQSMTVKLIKSRFDLLLIALICKKNSGLCQEKLVVQDGLVAGPDRPFRIVRVGKKYHLFVKTAC